MGVVVSATCMRLQRHVIVAAAMLAASAAVFAGESPQAPTVPDVGNPAQTLPRPATPREAPAPRASDRCYTPAANCILADSQRVGSQCWCVTPFGPSYGTVR